MRISAQRGFTIIELVVVIAILGILAAVAMPKFASLEANARTASLNGIRGAFTAAVQLTHAKWLANGTGVAEIALPLDGDTVRVNVTGWPTVETNDATQDTGGELYGILLSGPLPVVGWTSTESTADDAGVADFTLAGTGGGSFCYDGADGTVVTGVIAGAACP